MRLYNSVDPFLLVISKFSSYKHIMRKKKRISLEYHYIVFPSLPFALLRL